ncbi:hypothetical protein [Actinoplanes sp. NPDC051494]|uniref:hypothetical protein n=1 Tax=Actinoplanes sp. NPDC051494 TaxID=3363907 RepID=UPI00379EAF91
MSGRPNVDADPIARERLARQRLAAPPLVCRERVLQVIQDRLSAGQVVTRLTLADDFDVSPSHFGLRRTIHELADAGLIRLVPDESGIEDYVITTPARTRRRAA